MEGTCSKSFGEQACLWDDLFQCHFLISSGKKTFWGKLYFVKSQKFFFFLIPIYLFCLRCKTTTTNSKKHKQYKYFLSISQLVLPFFICCCSTTLWNFIFIHSYTDSNGEIAHRYTVSFIACLNEAFLFTGYCSKWLRAENSYSSSVLVGAKHPLNPQLGTKPHVKFTSYQV